LPCYPPLAELTRYIKEHLHVLADYRRWRLKPAVLRSTPVRIDVLWHQPPQSHLQLKLAEDLSFYLPLLIQQDKIDELGAGAEIEINDSVWRLYDPYLHPPALRALLTAARQGNAGRLNLELPRMGRFGSPGRNPLANLRRLDVEPLAGEGDEPSTNYIYRVRLESDTNRVAAVLKRYLPRERPESGRREWELATTLASELVPRPLGRLIDGRGELTLAACYEFVEGREVGELIWRLLERLTVDPFNSITARLRVIFGKTLHTLAAFYERLPDHLGDGLGGEAVLERLLAKARRDFETVKHHRPADGPFQRTLDKVREYAAAGAYHGPRPIHGDLMWRQLLWRKAPWPIPVRDPVELPGRLTLLDTESRRGGFLEEDLAGLAAANNFMLAQQGHYDYAPSVFAAFWHACADQLQALDAALTDVKPLLSLVRLRHLHDAAYYTLAQNRRLVRSEQYEGFVRFSLRMAGLTPKEHDGRR
jgi:hypothetical protein